MSGDEGPKDASLPQRRLVLSAVGCLGVSSMIVQVVLLREMLGAFCGNELVLGVILANWMLLTGLGAWAGRASHRWRNPWGGLIACQLLVALLPLAQVALLRVLRDVIFVRGAMIGLGQTLLAGFVLLAPYCLVSGFMLTLACRMLADGPGIRRVYLADTLGSVAGGVLVSFVLLRWFGHFGALYVPTFLNLLCAAGASVLCRGRTALCLAIAAILGVAVAAWRVNPEGLLTAVQYPSQEVLFVASSPYGRLVVTRSAGQVNFIENGLPVLSSDNVEQMEETVHYALAQRPGARKVLLLGGGASGTAREVLKYPVDEVTCLELDPLTIEAARRWVPENLDDPRIKVVIGDARTFVRTGGQRYDVIIVDTPDPSTALLNRLYTAEFYRDAKKRLVPDGVLSFPLGQYAEAVSGQLGRILATADTTLRRSFGNVLLIPGGRVFFLASDGPLYGDIASRIEEARVRTALVNRHYLEAVLAGDRLAEVQRAARQPAPVNEDFSPVLYYYHLLHWTSRFEGSPYLAAVVLVAAVAVYLFRIPLAPRVIFASGLAATALEVVVLLAFQVICGSLYSQIGMIVTVFMIGLAAGAFSAGRLERHSPRKVLAGAGFALAVFAVLLPFALQALGNINQAGTSGMLVQAVIALLTFTLAAIVGVQFPLAARVDSSGAAAVASRLYTADFLGACLGAILASAIAIPLLGVMWTSMLTGAVCAVAAGSLLWRKH